MEENKIEVLVTAPAQSSTLKNIGAVTAIATALAVAGPANAAVMEVPDMTEIITLITGMVAVVASVGMAVLSVYATGKVFKWVKTAF